MPIIAIYAIIAAVIFGAGFAVGDHLTANSYKAKMLDVANEKIKDDGIVAVEVAASVQRVHDFRDEQDKNLMGVINEREKAIADLERRERDSVNRGLFVSASACSGQNGMPGKTDSASVAISGAGRVRLSAQDEHDIRTDYGDAQRVVIQYNACREKLKSLVEIGE